MTNDNNDTNDVKTYKDSVSVVDDNTTTDDDEMSV
jgi:hypothetical protein